MNSSAVGANCGRGPTGEERVRKEANYETVAQCIAAPKAWAASQDMRSLWRQLSFKRFPAPWFFRVSPEIAGVAVEGVHLDVYLKRSSILGNRPKISFSLMVNTVRAIGYDDNGPAGEHRNLFIDGLPHSGRAIGFPHVNMAVAQALEGYAEPLDVMPAEDLWLHFLARANILGAPSFMFPAEQMGFEL